MSNPAHLVAKPGVEKPRDRVLSENEIRRVWAALDAESPRVATAFRVALLTAQRKSEVLGLRWSEVDGEWWTIPGERAKNGRAHRVYLTTQARALLEGLHDDGADLLFAAGKYATNTKPLGNLQKPMARVKAASGVNFRFHDLRRTAATHLGGLRVKRFIIERVLNHADATVTGKSYDHYTYDLEKRAALTRWDAKVTAIVSGAAREPAKVVAIGAA